MVSKRSDQQKAAQRFWDALKSCAETNHVRPDRSFFYVKWAQAFVDFLPEKRLRNRSGQDIQAFLEEIGKRPGIKEWQVEQAGHALKILYEVFLPNYAPAPISQPKNEQTNHTPSFPDGRKKPVTFRDCLVPGEVERKYSSLLGKLKTEIRSRHYSIRTETAYLDWTRRFIAFSDV